MNAVSQVGGTAQVHLPELTAAPSTSDASFAAHLEQAVGGVNEAVSTGDAALKALASGGDVDLHGSMIALEEADLALRAMVSVRDKVVNAYEQLMNLAI